MISVISNMPAHFTLLAKATEHDISAITRIYSHYVLNTTFTLEETPPIEEEMQARWQKCVHKHLPFIVAKQGEQIVGYAYATPYRSRSGYRFTLEESVYIDKEYGGQGIGKLLLSEIIKHTSEMGYKQLIAVICGEENQASIRLHKSLGFTKAGILKAAGFKHKQWIDTLLMQKVLA